MSRRLKGKVAIVTGASRGIGRAIAVALGAEGARIVLSGRSEPDLKATAERVTAAGGTAEIVSAELADEAAVRHLIETTKNRWDRLDILVNNAGITHSAPFAETTTEDLDRCWAINARAPFILCREALPLLKQAERGRIINIASVVAVKGYALQSAYTASKHALRGMSMSLAEELRGSDVRVHVVCPGGVDTELVSRVRPDIDKADLIGPDELAELVVYLVTHKGNAVLDELHVRRVAAAPWFVS
jgi:NAD(P)-dependent dehydrogenase (short-subunit alcohol dehydrogenase family)